MKVLVAHPGLARWLISKKELMPEHVEILVPKEGTDDELLSLSKDVEVIVAVRLSPEVVKNAVNLKLIQKTGAGVDAIPFEVIKPETYVANTSGANPVPLAEGTISLMFALAKRVVQRHNAFPNVFRMQGTELRGKKVGIIGLGNIGKEIAKRLQAFDMKILGLKRQPSDELKDKLNLDFLGGPDDLDFLLKESDFVIVIAPLTPATRGLIGKRELDLMKPTAYIINVARAGLIQEEPLYNALKDGKIAGAGIDVWWIPHWWDPKWSPEINKPSRFPIWELKNVINSPHSIGGVEMTKYSENGLKIMAENITRIYENKVPINLVDKEHQY